MSWKPAEEALACGFCGHRESVPEGGALIVEHALEDAGGAARGLGLELRVARCEECGAGIAFEGAALSKTCSYCGSPNVLPQEANRNALRPESLVPLELGRREVEKRFRRWLKGLWFRPNALRKAGIAQAAGIYVPFWTFDCKVHSEWAAQAGYYYWVTETYTAFVNGRPQVRTRQVRRIRWEPAWGRRDDVYDDLLVPASRSLPTEMAARMDRFDTTALVPYRPEYLAGWRAEEYQIDLEQGWEEARNRIANLQRERCGEDVPGDTWRALLVHNLVSETRWKLVLLPVWSLQYSFRKKTHTVLVNGQTGQVVGKAPWSWAKILILALAGSAAVLAAFLGLQ
ncbi:MAG: hypothetical protein ACE5H3_01605 [Planctomycetota bacterium]